MDDLSRSTLQLKAWNFIGKRLCRILKLSGGALMCLCLQSGERCYLNELQLEEHANLVILVLAIKVNTDENAQRWKFFGNSIFFDSSHVQSNKF